MTTKVYIGVFIDQDGSKYEGSFKSGQKHGLGVHTKLDGERFEGEYVNG